MPDTYTTVLNLTKPEVGASTDTWGSKGNSNLDAIDALFDAGPVLKLAKGGTGAATASGARTNLGLGSIATLDADNAPSTHGFVPVGFIGLWSGSVASIPAGWNLCDGTNGTPDLRDRFVVGAGSSYAVDATGGSSTTTLSEANLPAHTHSFSATTSSNGSHSHTGSTSTDGNHNHNNGAYSHILKYDGTGTYSGSSDNGAQPNLQSSLAMTTTGAHSHSITTNTTGAHTHTVSGTSGSTGSGSSFDNKPPYYALAYIMRVA